MIDEVLKQLSGLGVPDDLIAKIKESISSGKESEEEVCAKCKQPIKGEVSVEVTKEKPASLDELMKKFRG